MMQEGSRRCCPLFGVRLGERQEMKGGGVNGQLMSDGGGAGACTDA
jgi:hypothetical protein